MEQQTPSNDPLPQRPEAPEPLQPGAPENPQPNPDQRAADQFDLMELKSARTLSTVATIAGPVSFIIGGVALSSVALVCAILAFTKTRRVLRKGPGPNSSFANIVKQTAIMGIFISCVALVLNLIGLIAMIPILMDAMQTGDYSAILGEGATSLQGGTGAPSDGNGGGNPWG